MAENYEIIAGHIKEKIEPKASGTRPVETAIHKQELFGIGEIKAQQTKLEEIEATKAAEASKINLSRNITPKESKKNKTSESLFN